VHGLHWVDASRNLMFVYAYIHISLGCASHPLMCVGGGGVVCMLRGMPKAAWQSSAPANQPIQYSTSSAPFIMWPWGLMVLGYERYQVFAPFLLRGQLAVLTVVMRSKSGVGTALPFGTVG
jgi:hypothetical protein